MSNIHETINNAQEKAWSSVNCIDDLNLLDYWMSKTRAIE